MILIGSFYSRYGTIQEDTSLFSVPQSLPFVSIENASAVAAVISEDVSCAYKYTN